MYRTLSRPIRDNLDSSSSNIERGQYIRRNTTSLYTSNINQPRIEPQPNMEPEAAMALRYGYYIPQLRPLSESPPSQITPIPMRNNRSVSNELVPAIEQSRIYANGNSGSFLPTNNLANRVNRIVNSPTGGRNQVASTLIKRENRAVPNLTTGSSFSAVPEYYDRQRRSNKRSASRKLADMRTGSPYLSISNNVVRTHSTGDSSRRRRSHSINYTGSHPSDAWEIGYCLGSGATGTVMVANS
ncbi:hypothetical protein INT48_006322 [Thamnidium elegans]|uniref:Uncharacterized protein n=1 Tax=Thamnidium elegans TaxID=101142 RepID=A0A8H7SMT8_9FUNG|nr:hypothetical protein INT48_006322 [Thamnidium elegans]